jgi:hypothetical protein
MSNTRKWQSMHRLRRIKSPIRAKRLHREPEGIEEFQVSDLVIFRRRNRGHTVFSRHSERFERDRPEYVLPTEEFETVTEIATTNPE